MSKKAEQKRREEIRKQLGVGQGCANNRLMRKILFNLIKQAGLNVCFQCEEKINLESEFSIEHKTPWFNSTDARSLYFDLNNIAFSHLKCNIGAARKGTRLTAKSGFKGVVYHSKRRSPKKWRAQTNEGNGATYKIIHIGWYSTAEEAALAYDAAVLDRNKVTNKDLGLL